jgi:hypothetical protein
MLAETINELSNLIFSISKENLQDLTLLVLALSIWILALKVRAISNLNGIRDLLAAKKVKSKNKNKNKK